MASGNLFKRKGLLPLKGPGDGGSDTQPPGAEVARGQSEGDPTDEDSDDDVFMRPTIVPDFSGFTNGLESGPPSPNTLATTDRTNASDHNVTARPPEHRPRRDEPPAPNANTFVTIPAAAHHQPRSNVTRDRARDITPLEAPPEGVHSWASHRGGSPRSDGPESLPHSFSKRRAPATDALDRDRLTPLVPSSQPDPWGPSSAVESSHNALGFVDALPRLTTRPPDREYHAARRSEDGERTSVISLSELFALSDFSGALQMAELRLATNPGDTEAQRYAQDCRRVLIKMQISRLGSLQQVPEVAIDRDELQWLSLDHRAGFILSLVDGQLTIDDLLDICGMQRLDALQIVAELVEKKVLHLRGAQ